MCVHHGRVAAQDSGLAPVDEIITFVLVIISTYTGEPVTVVPGYESQKACETAALQFVEKERGGSTRRSGHVAFCIPGPTRKS